MPRSTDRFLITLVCDEKGGSFSAKASMHRATMSDTLKASEVHCTEPCTSRDRNSALAYALTELTVALSQGKVKL